MKKKGKTTKAELSNENSWQSFIQLCAETVDAKTLTLLFDLFFTLEEKKDFAKRFLIIQELLKEQMPQRELAETLGVSIAKITRGSNALKTVSTAIKQILKQP